MQHLVPALPGARRPALHTLLAIEGGPGYPTVGSAGYYLAMLGPARRTTALVLVDQRGTGESELIDCAPLQDFPYAPFAPVALRPYRLAVGRCGALLGSRSDAYGTGAAVDDMVDVLDALGLARVDVYGDSYGSFAAQALALRHPGRVRSLVLDGTYPLDFDPWARDALAVLRTPARDLRPLADVPVAGVRSGRARRDARAQLRARPLEAVVARCRRRSRARAPRRPRPRRRARRGRRRARDLPRPAGGRRGASTAATARRSRGSRPRPSPAAPTVPRSTTRRASTRPSSATTTRSSSTLAARPAARLAQIAAGLRALPADAFAPFDKATWFGADLESYDWCVRWPRATHAPDPARPPGAAYPSIPTLVLDGDLDQRTSLIGARRVAAQFPRQHARAVAEPGPRDGARRLAAAARRASCGASSRPRA